MPAAPTFGFSKHILQILLSVLVACLVTACGGGGSDSQSADTSTDAIVASQIAEVQPDNDIDTTSVFVRLGNASSPAAGVEVSSGPNREQLQQQFIADLQAATQPRVLWGITLDAPCDLTGFAQQLDNAHKFTTDAVVRIDLTACQLNLLKTLPNVKGVFSDVTLEHLGITAPSAVSISNFNTAVDFSFNSSPSRQINTSSIGSGSPKNLDGNGVVIAILDTGVEDRHPALQNTKILPGACFSTPVNGGTNFCQRASQVVEPYNNTDPNQRVARSCAALNKSDGLVWGSIKEGISAGCAHGTAMASAAAMGISSASPNTAYQSVKGGVAPQASILPVQVFSKSGSAIYASGGDLLAALEWLALEAERRKSAGLAPIVAANLSLGGGTYSQNCDSDYVGGLFNQAFGKLRSLGVLPVVAAGNNGIKTSVSFPACASNAFTVAATQLDGLTPASYSNFSSQVKLFAIGGDSSANGEYALPTLCTDGNNFDCWSTIRGTSPATALVSGGVAALRSLKPTATLSETERALTSTVGGSSKSLTSNGITRPAMRLTSSGHQLFGISEPNIVAPIPTPTPFPSSASLGRVCFYPQANYQGSPQCFTFEFANWDQWYKLNKRVGSIKVEPVNGAMPSSTAKVTYFHYYLDFAFGYRGVTRSGSISNTSSLGFWSSSTPNIWGVRIQAPQ